jgi:hypothetical protein
MRVCCWRGWVFGMLMQLQRGKRVCYIATAAGGGSVASPCNCAGVHAQGSCLVVCLLLCCILLLIGPAYRLKQSRVFFSELMQLALQRSCIGRHVCLCCCCVASQPGLRSRTVNAGYAQARLMNDVMFAAQ